MVIVTDVPVTGWAGLALIAIEAFSDRIVTGCAALAVADDVERRREPAAEEVVPREGEGVGDRDGSGAGRDRRVVRDLRSLVGGRRRRADRRRGRLLVGDEELRRGRRGRRGMDLGRHAVRRIVDRQRDRVGGEGGCREARSTRARRSRRRRANAAGGRIAEGCGVSMRPPYRVDPGAPARAAKPWTFLTDLEPRRASLTQCEAAARVRRRTPWLPTLVLDQIWSTSCPLRSRP